MLILEGAVAYDLVICLENKICLRGAFVGIPY